ncbi:MAG: cryptochrome/photolyase family protein [Gammaproteobacteria bacterium]|nr:cryptochrome/photolyase family protein [Gammaproteobacteria bacterium]
MIGPRLVLVLGDQLDRDARVLSQCDQARDRIVMIESRAESLKVASHKARSALFLAAMRHHRDWLVAQGFRVDYVDIDKPEAESFETALAAVIARHEPHSVLMTEAGEYSVQQSISHSCQSASVELEVEPDDHFLCDRATFETWASNRKTLVMEHFYRHMRQSHDILMVDGQPTGGHWNYDRQNRHAFGRQGPGLLPRPPAFTPDRVTQSAIRDVERLFPGNPGSLDAFDWPVTREQALAALDDFVDHRLAAFGPFQDAMWSGEPFLQHSLLSAALNLKLLNPREVIDIAIAAADAGRAPIQSVEGFVRQILGWREFVRGVYWRHMPAYLDSNALGAEADLPGFFWTGNTDMACLADAIGQTLRFGYAHHIQRLMVTGLFTLLLGVRPQQVHAWYLAVYVDAVEWVEAPNTLGMSQYADGGVLASKPYVASGRYINRMSNYCSHCRYAPDKATGPHACPFTTLYWDFLIRHAPRFASHPRSAMQWRNLARVDEARRTEIRAAADQLRLALG